MSELIRKIKDKTRKNLLLIITGSVLTFLIVDMEIYKINRIKRNLEPNAVYINGKVWEDDNGRLFEGINEDRDRNGKYESYAIDQNTGREYTVECGKDNKLRFYTIWEFE